jgi:hypothetical protein
MRKILLIISLVLLLNLSLVSAITQQEINEVKDLIDSKVSCDKLTNEQLEILGEYYMEQMHPGEAHEAMHEMMGMKEGSEAEEQFHINLARMTYCGEGGMMGSGGMMNMMMGGNIMGSSGMNMMESGMMGNWGYGFSYRNFINVLYVVLLIGLIILVYFWIIKLWRDSYAKKRQDRQ